MSRIESRLRAVEQELHELDRPTKPSGIIIYDPKEGPPDLADCDLPDPADYEGDVVVVMIPDNGRGPQQ